MEWMSDESMNESLVFLQFPDVVLRRCRSQMNTKLTYQLHVEGNERSLMRRVLYDHVFNYFNFWRAWGGKMANGFDSFHGF